MKKTIYTKYSTERSDRLKIVTSIVKNEDGGMQVEKRAAHDKAQPHIESLVEKYKDLKEYYEDSIIEPILCKVINGRAVFPYIEGESLESRLNKYIDERDYKGILFEIENYKKMITDNVEIVPFHICDEFISVFGANYPEEGRDAFKISDIDLIFSNIIISNGKWKIIDYEWTFDFPVPVDYIIYRAIKFYAEIDTKRCFLTDNNICGFLGISERERKTYDEMENVFQSYVYGEHIPTWKLYESIRGRNMYLQDIISSNIEFDGNVQIFYDYGEGFSEENSYKILKQYDNPVELEIDVNQGTEMLRLDPSMHYCVVKILEVFGVERGFYDLPVSANGVLLDDQCFAFPTEDPQIYIRDFREGTTKVVVKYEIQLLDREFAYDLCKGFSTVNERIDRISAESQELNEKQVKIIEQLNDKIQISETNLEQIKTEKVRLETENRIQQESIATAIIQRDLLLQSTSWKITKPCRTMAEAIKKNKFFYRLFRLFQIWKKEGARVLLYKINNRIFQRKCETSSYESWLKIIENDGDQVKKLRYNPLISVVIPVYNVPENMLMECVESVLNQTYQNFELCMADDASTMPNVRKVLKKYESNKKIKITYRQENGHISRSTNSAIELATGEYIAFMDCDDVLAKNALYEVVSLLNENQELDYIYSDEDKISEDGKHRHTPHFKPDWSPDTLMSLMYTSHLSVYRKEIGDQLGWLRVGFEGAQDYDFTLRFTEKTQKIGHIPKILYHWRVRKESTSANIEAKDYVVEASKKAKTEALERRKYSGFLEWIPDIYQWRICYEASNRPLVSVIIPTKDNFTVYQRCIDTLIKNTKYKNYEIITVDNGSVDNMKGCYEEYAAKHHIQYIYQPMEFNFSRMCNLGVQHSQGEYVLLLNDDMEIVSGEWMERMVGHAALPYIGAVGAKLLYPGTSLIQHVGVVAFDSGPSHTLCRYSDEDVLYFNRNRIEYNYSAVTAACLMVSRKKYDEVNGMDESFAVAYNDVNFCYNLVEKGYYNVVRNDAVLYHHESLSRGDDTLDPVKFERLKREREKLNQAHPQFALGDPLYNPNLTMKRGDYSLNMDIIDSKKACIITSVSLPEYNESEISMAAIERIIKNEKYIQLIGYYVIRGSRKNNARVTHIFLIGKNNVYRCSTRKEYRTDINLITGCDGKNNLSGFCAIFPIEEIEDGSYRIVLEKNGMFVDSGKEVVIHNNI